MQISLAAKNAASSSTWFSSQRSLSSMITASKYACSITTRRGGGGLFFDGLPTYLSLLFYRAARLRQDLDKNERRKSVRKMSTPFYALLCKILNTVQITINISSSKYFSRHAPSSWKTLQGSVAEGAYVLFLEAHQHAVRILSEAYPATWPPQTRIFNFFFTYCFFN